MRQYSKLDALCYAIILNHIFQNDNFIGFNNEFGTFEMR